jgi:hypothetical protein
VTNWQTGTLPSVKKSVYVKEKKTFKMFSQVITTCKTGVLGSSTLVNGRVAIFARRIMKNSALFNLVCEENCFSMHLRVKQIQLATLYAPLFVLTWSPVTKYASNNTYVSGELKQTKCYVTWGL